MREELKEKLQKTIKLQKEAKRITKILGHEIQKIQIQLQQLNNQNKIKNLDEVKETIFNILEEINGQIG